MSRSRMWTVGTAVVVVMILLAGWFLLISPKRSDAASANAAADSTIAANQSVEAQIRQLKLEQKQLPAERAQIAAIRRQMPTLANEPALIRQLANDATTADVDMTSITPSALTGVSADPGVAYIPTTILVTGGFSTLKDYLNELEEDQRAVLVTGFNITKPQNPGTKPTDLQMTITARVFVTTDANGSGTATAGGTTSGTTTTPGTSSTPSSSSSPAAPTGASGTAN